MADTGNSNAGLGEHEATWAGFTALMKWGSIGVALVTAFVVFLIAN